MIFDNLDKKILQHLSNGTSSYEELAHQCNVTRNTVYRRISLLEEKGVIKNTLHCIINMEQMDITTVNIGAKILQINQDKAIMLLSKHKNVKFLWRTYGDYDVIILAFCSKGQEGQVIHELRDILEDLGAEYLSVSVGYAWEKANFSPFEEKNEGGNLLILEGSNRKKETAAILG